MLARVLLLAALAAAACETAQSAPETVIRVEAPGPGKRLDDAGSLAEALDRVAALRARDPRRPVVVALGPGLHRLSEPARIGPEHGGVPGAPSVIRGAPGGATRIVGSVPVAQVPVPRELAARLPEPARAHVRAYRLPPAAADPAHIRPPRYLRTAPTPPAFEVYDRQGALTPARWPNAGFARVAEAGSGAEPSFRLADAPAGRWRGEDDLFAEGYWQFDWLFETVPVTGIDPRRDGLRLETAPDGGIRTGARVRIVHALSELDEPGEWWRDRARGLLLVWPRAGGEAIEVSVADTLIQVEGARHIRIEGLRLERARGDLLTVHDGEDVVVRDSALAWAGIRAAVFEDVRGGGIEACAVSDTGFGGIRLVGGDRERLIPGGLRVRDTRLTGYARRSRTQSPAIEVEGVGNMLTGNYIHDAIDYAVHIRGNDHLVADNEIARVLMGATDSGAIYAGRDWTARGNAIRGNFLHDIRTEPGFEVKGVYLDDLASGFTVADNLFVRVDQAVFIGGGRDNTVDDNVFVASNPAIHLDARGLDAWAQYVADPASEIRTALAAMPVASPAWRRRYPTLADILARKPGAPTGNRAAGNVFLDSTPFVFEEPARPQDLAVLRNVGPVGVTALHAASPDDSRPEDFAALALDGRPLPRRDFSRMRRSGLPETFPGPRATPAR